MPTTAGLAGATLGKATGFRTKQRFPGDEELRALLEQVVPVGRVGIGETGLVDLEERAVRGYAEVAWIRARFGGVERPRGMGLRFVFILDGGGRYLGLRLQRLGLLYRCHDNRIVAAWRLLRRF